MCVTHQRLTVHRWLEAVVRARWLVPLVQIGELVYPLLTVLVRLHVELCCPPAPEVRLRLSDTDPDVKFYLTPLLRLVSRLSRVVCRIVCGGV